MSDVLFSFDGMSETALTFKIKALKKLGQKAYAPVSYTHLVGRSLSEIVEKKGPVCPPISAKL